MTTANSSSLPAAKRFRQYITCLVDLPNEILLAICRYITPVDVLRAFFTPETPDARLHRVILTYRTYINLSATTFSEHHYIKKLFIESCYSLRPLSLTINHERIPFVTKWYFNDEAFDHMNLLLDGLKQLTLIECTRSDLDCIMRYLKKLKQLEQLHIFGRNYDEDTEINSIISFNFGFHKLLFDDQLPVLSAVTVELQQGLTLCKSLRINTTISYIDVALETIDDVHLLLDGLIPNVKTMIVHVRQARLLNYYNLTCTGSCSHLTEFTFLASSIGIVLDDLESILRYMPALLKLTLSIHNTPDAIFCNGLLLEAVLNQHTPLLTWFHYTMTHPGNNLMPTKPFVQWPMSIVVYQYENISWIHIFSLPWPYGQQDKRQLPISTSEYDISVTPRVKQVEHMDHIYMADECDIDKLKTRFRRVHRLTTIFSIINNCDILPQRIHTLSLTDNIGHILHSTRQPQVHILHLIVHHRLTDETELFILSRQFPNVRYLELSLPLNAPAFRRFLAIIFCETDNKRGQRRYWSDLICFNTKVTAEQMDVMQSNGSMYLWFLQHTHLKFRTSEFLVYSSSSILSVWL